MNFSIPVQINFSQNFESAEFKEQPLQGSMSLGKNRIKHCKVICPFEVDVGPGTA
jgi:hypothetical protein